MKEPVIISWSGGKDSSLALHAILSDAAFSVVALITTVTAEYDRISMHGVRRSLLEEQALSLGLPLEKVFIQPVCTNQEYEAAMKAVFLKYKAQGIQTVIFGDLFLEDIRKYRDRLLADIGMVARYPLWGLNTAQLAQDFIRLGFQARLTCVNPQQLDAKFAGRLFDQSLLDELPATVDPCGENGEFHTFVFAGPIFHFPIHCVTGEVVTRNSFVFCDLLPVET